MSGQNRVRLKAGHFKGTTNVFWGVTRQVVGAMPKKVSMFRLVKCVNLAGRCIPCRNRIVTHNALQDASDAAVAGLFESQLTLTQD